MVLLKLVVTLRISSGRCSAGTYRDNKVISCTKCPENKVAEQDGATSCTSCTAGQMADAKQTKCGKHSKLLA